MMFFVQLFLVLLYILRKCLAFSLGALQLYCSTMKTVTIANLPPVLSGESFQCVFGDLGSGELTPLSGNMYSCRVPNIPSFTGEGEGGGGLVDIILPATWFSPWQVAKTSACMTAHFELFQS